MNGIMVTSFSNMESDMEGDVESDMEGNVEVDGAYNR